MLPPQIVITYRELDEDHNYKEVAFERLLTLTPEQDKYEEKEEDKTRRMEKKPAITISMGLKKVGDKWLVQRGASEEGASCKPGSDQWTCSNWNSPGPSVDPNMYKVNTSHASFLIASAPLKGG